MDSKLADAHLLLLSDDEDDSGADSDPYASESDAEDVANDEATGGGMEMPWKLRVGTNALLRVCTRLGRHG